MRKPVIGITANSLFTDGIERSFVNHSYIHSVLKAGGVPVSLPTLPDAADLPTQLNQVDGLIFSGGSDINPLLFGEEPDAKIDFILNDRDDYEIRLIQLAHMAGKPIFGICRGIQLINVAFGGTLYQDIGTQSPGCTLKHTQNTRRNFASHTVDIAPGSRLNEAVGAEVLTVNSYHHQAVKDIAPGFRITARSRDNIIEGIEKDGPAYIVGVQWHPELLVDSYPVMLELFKQLVAQAQKSIPGGNAS